MGDHTETTLPGDDVSMDTSVDKGKGKAVERVPDDVEMEGEDSSEDEDDLEDAVDEDEEGGNDNLEPISTDNILPSGRRTRGKEVNYAELAAKEKEAGEAAMDDDDDEDFKAPIDDEMEH
ncbi:Histone H2A.Z-specific chaperone CHZ1 [Microsporum audouinii]